MPRNVWNRYLIKTTDFEAQLIADMIEGGHGFTKTTDKVNAWRRRNRPDAIEVGRSCVYNLNKRMFPKVMTIKKRPQGSLDPNSDWTQASHRWATQLLLCYGELKQEQAPTKFLLTDLTCPVCSSYRIAST